MLVRDVMTANAATCREETTLAGAAARMWEKDCGALPVVDERGHVVGMITDRDICIAVGTRHRPAGEIAVSEVMSEDVATCSPTDDVQTAAAIMRLRRVRRLPVVNSEGLVVGLLTLDDIARRAETAHGVAVSPHEVVALMRAIRGGADRDENNVH